MYWPIMTLLCFFMTFVSLLRPQLSRICAFFVIVTLFIFLSNGYFNGIDWVNYYPSFVENQTLTDFLLAYEPVFGFVFFISKVVFSDFYAAVIFLYFLRLILLFKASMRLCGLLKINPCLFIFMMLILNSLELYVDQIRQFFAISFALYALSNIIEGKNLKFIISTILGILFHYSAIVILFYPLMFKTKKIVFLVGASIFLFMGAFATFYPYVTQILSLIGGPGNIISIKLNSYFSTKPDFSIGLLFVIDMLVVFVYLLNINFKNSAEKVLWNGCFFAAITHASFYFMPVFHRFDPYFTIFYCLSFGMYFSRLPYSYSFRSMSLMGAVTAVAISVALSFYQGPARPGNYKGYFFEYLSGQYNIDADKLKRCNEFETDVPFCRW